MQLTPIRIVSFALTSLVAVSACGQVTGLSNDYAFDLGDGGGKGNGDAAGDASASDGALDAAADGAETGAKCSTAQTTLASTRLSQLGGTQACRSCLAASCCTDVEPCTSASDCRRHLSCMLDCTPKAADQRPDCFANCTGNVPAVYTNGIGACSIASCDAHCGFPP
jgi:hypothetical protein